MIQVLGPIVIVKLPSLHVNVQACAKFSIDLVILPSGKIDVIHTMIVDELQDHEVDAFQVVIESHQQEAMV